jgi:uncharacterized repeat protein (TIGR04052 family)
MAHSFFHARSLGVLIAGSLLAAAAAGCGDSGGGSSSSEASSSTSGGTGGTGGAGGAGGAGGQAGDVDVAITFEGRVGDKAFDCSQSYAALGTAATEVKLTDFRLYIHDVRLLKAGSGEEVSLALEQDGLWQHESLALLDFEDKSGSCANGTAEVNSAVRGKAPAGDYDGIAFKLGVPFEMNHQDASVAPSPLNLSALFWSWNGGYKFVRVDSAPAAGGDAFNLHLGSTGCVGDNGDVTSCARPNVAEIVLSGFDAATSKIVVDYAAVVAASDLSKNAGAPGCMSGEMDPECGPIFERLGLDIADGSTHPEKQTLFRVE